MVPGGFLLTQPLGHSGAPLSVLRVPCSFLLTQPLGRSGVPLSVLKVPGGFLQTQPLGHSGGAPECPKGSRWLSAYPALRTLGGRRVPCSLLTQPLGHSGAPLRVLRIPCSLLLTQPLGHSGVPLSVLRVPGGFLLTQPLGHSGVPLSEPPNGSRWLSAYPALRTLGGALECPKGSM